MGRVCAALTIFRKWLSSARISSIPLCKRRRSLDTDPRHFLIADHADLFLFRLRPNRFGPIGRTAKYVPQRKQTAMVASATSPKSSWDFGGILVSREIISRWRST